MAKKTVEHWDPDTRTVELHEVDPAVDHPAHYNRGIEAIEIIESWNLNFAMGNVIKYVLRAPYKGSQIQDLEKARIYISREIERLKRDESR